MITKLANDICRCHDETCKDRFKCLRYLERNTGGERTPHLPSMFPYDIPIYEDCTNFIGDEDEQTS